MPGLTAGSAFPLQKEGVNREPQRATESDAMPYDEVMKKWKDGTLKSGSTGEPVKDQDQAVAIMLSEKRKAMAGKKEYQSKKPKGIAAHMREAAEKN